MFMKTVKVGVLRMTYQLSYGLGAFATFENNHVHYHNYNKQKHIICQCLAKIHRMEYKQSFAYN